MSFCSQEGLPPRGVCLRGGGGVSHSSQGWDPIFQKMGEPRKENGRPPSTLNTGIRSMCGRYVSLRILNLLTFNEWSCITSQIPGGPGEPCRVDVFEGVGVTEAGDSDADAPGTAGRMRLRVVK